MKTMKTLLTTIILSGLLVGAMSLTSCSSNTAEKAGKKIDNAADKVQDQFSQGPAEKAGEALDNKADKAKTKAKRNYYAAKDKATD